MCRDVDGSATHCMDKSVKRESGIGTKGALFAQICVSCDEINSGKREHGYACVAYQFRYTERGLDDDVRMPATEKLKLLTMFQLSICGVSQLGRLWNDTMLIRTGSTDESENKPWFKLLFTLVECATSVQVYTALPPN
jgi:hypothetical protein